MKKRLVSLALAALLLVAVPLSAFATSGFNQHVFDGRNDIINNTDDMTGEITIFPSSDYYGSIYVPLSSSAFIGVSAGIASNDYNDLFALIFDYTGIDWAGIESIIIKIGDNRYTFSDFYKSSYVTDEGLADEYIAFPLKKETLGFINDFCKHQNEEIKVRLNGSVQTFDFILSPSEKNAIVGLYNLYVAGGGTQEANLRSISNDDVTHVELNGKILA